MATQKMKYVEIMQDNKNVQHVVFLPTEMELCTFILSRKASSSNNAELVKRIGQAYESYFMEIFK